MANKIQLWEFINLPQRQKQQQQLKHAANVIGNIAHKFLLVKLHENGSITPSPTPSSSLYTFNGILL